MPPGSRNLPPNKEPGAGPDPGLVWRFPSAPGPAELRAAAGTGWLAGWPGRPLGCAGLPRQPPPPRSQARPPPPLLSPPLPKVQRAASQPAAQACSGERLQTRAGGSSLPHPRWASAPALARPAGSAISQRRGRARWPGLALPQSPQRGGRPAPQLSPGKRGARFRFQVSNTLTLSVTHSCRGLGPWRAAWGFRNAGPCSRSLTPLAGWLCRGRGAPCVPALGQSGHCRRPRSQWLGPVNLASRGRRKACSSLAGEMSLRLSSWSVCCVLSALEGLPGYSPSP